MYRFNGQDKRLDRLLLCTVMIMEALHGFEHKYQYSIVGMLVVVIVVIVIVAADNFHVLYCIMSYQASLHAV